MSKNKQSKSHLSGKQEKLKNATEPVPGDNPNQHHNINKEALGPNTRR